MYSEKRMKKLVTTLKKYKGNDFIVINNGSDITSLMATIQGSNFDVSYISTKSKGKVIFYLVISNASNNKDVSELTFPIKKFTTDFKDTILYKFNTSMDIVSLAISKKSVDHTTKATIH